MKKSITIGLLVAASLTLAACSKGNTTSGVGQGGQQTSNATNNGGGVGTGGGGGSAGINTLPEGDGFVPKHCAVIGYTPAEVPKLVGCSVDSFNKCKCYDPTNPGQIN